MEDVPRADEVVHAAAERTSELVARLRELSGEELHAASSLPSRSRLTIVCHLRYGTSALLRMTSDALAGRATAYYPEGRATQRPLTLIPARGEVPDDVLDDWETTAARLDRLWDPRDSTTWSLIVTEPADNPDLGTVPLARLALSRLTEVEVHGVDLDIGASDWSDRFVDVALPTRLRSLSTRRSNHRAFDNTLQGTWLLIADAFRWSVTVRRDQVASGPADEGVGPPRATIRGTRRDLLAMLLGRPLAAALDVTGDRDFGISFGRAFPGP